MPAALFPRPPVVRFVSERTVCHCGDQLVVQKTRRKAVLSMTGPFVAHETLLHCPSCSRIFGSDALLQLVPKWCNVGYDVLVYVGRALFQRYRTIQEVSTELYLRNVQISDSEISYLGYKFISCLAACHQQATPKIRQSMGLSGGYVLHLDATHDGNAPALMTGMDSLSEIVLGNVKVPSEHAEHIVPFLQKLQKDFGTPQACVHDMGKGICKAVSEVFPGIPDFICHFHFLRDIGKDFLEPAYSSLHSCLRKHKTSPRLYALAREIKQRLSGQDSDPELLAKAFLSGELPENTDLLPLASAYSMTLWMLQGKHSGDGYGFPFDRPLLVFAERLLEGQQHLPELLACCHDTDKTGKQSVIKLARIVSDIINDTRFQQEVQELRWRCQVFDSLRKAMRIALPDGRNGLNDDGTDEAISTICASVQRFRSKLDNNAKWSADKLCRKMAKQIDKWSEKLFADPIEVDTPRGTVIIYPQRTNNILEQFFRGIRRGQRRKTGNNSIRRMLQTMLADTPLVKNLDNDEYMKILLDGKANLEELFADLELTATARSADPPVGVDRLLPGFRRLITQQTLPMQVAQLLSKNEIMAESN
ncbi:MAG: transposase [Deltaproteobacteria bacterium]|nr:transposase [Deltaproteobacteria bacterium]